MQAAAGTVNGGHGGTNARSFGGARRPSEPLLSRGRPPRTPLAVSIDLSSLDFGHERTSEESMERYARSGLDPGAGQVSGQLPERRVLESKRLELGVEPSVQLSGRARWRRTGSIRVDGLPGAHAEQCQSWQEDE
jgi:hypothetical protein